VKVFSRRNEGEFVGLSLVAYVQELKLQNNRMLAVQRSFKDACVTVERSARGRRVLEGVLRRSQERAFNFTSMRYDLGNTSNSLKVADDFTQ
jgi:hypothetical protein